MAKYHLFKGGKMGNKFDNFLDRLMEVLQVYLLAWGFTVIMIFIYNVIKRSI